MARNPSLETVTGDHDSINARSELQLSGARSNQLTTRPQRSGGEADNGRHMPGTRLHTARATQESGGSYPPSPVLGWRGWGECQHQDWSSLLDLCFCTCCAAGAFKFSLICFFFFLPIPTAKRYLTTSEPGIAEKHRRTERVLSEGLLGSL